MRSRFSLRSPGRDAYRPLLKSPAAWYLGPTVSGRQHPRPPPASLCLPFVSCKQKAEPSVPVPRPPAGYPRVRPIPPIRPPKRTIQQIRQRSANLGSCQVESPILATNRLSGSCSIACRPIRGTVCGPRETIYSKSFSDAKVLDTSYVWATDSWSCGSRQRQRQPDTNQAHRRPCPTSVRSSSGLTTQPTSIFPHSAAPYRRLSTRCDQQCRSACPIDCFLPRNVAYRRRLHPNGGRFTPGRSCAIT